MLGWGAQRERSVAVKWITEMEEPEERVEEFIAVDGLSCRARDSDMYTKVYSVAK